MPAGRVPPFDARIYRAALRLCPGEFHRDHGAEMALDYDEAVADAVASGSGASAQRLLLGVDLLRTIAVQWLRTGLPAIAGVAAATSLAVMAALASAVRAVTARLRSDVETSEGVAAVLLSAVVVMVIVTTIVFSLSWYRPRRPGRR